MRVESTRHAVEMDVGYKKMRASKMAKVFFLSTSNVGVVSSEKELWIEQVWG